MWGSEAMFPVGFQEQNTGQGRGEAPLIVKAIQKLNEQFDYIWSFVALLLLCFGCWIIRVFWGVGLSVALGGMVGG